MKFKKILASVTAVALSCTFGAGAIACGDDKETWTPPKNTDAYNIPQDYYRTYYEVFVRSFADGNGDGIGDLQGLIDNLDYLNDGDDSTMTDLGINGIWMMPINASPSYHKYDVSDYYSIDKEYGTLEDFDKLVEECNKRDIWLQMDLVLNHTSTKHQWFLDAVASAQNGNDPATDVSMSRYSFVQASSKPQGNWYKVNRTDDYWYLGNFSSEMPDVNLANNEVREEIKHIVDFWLERGVKSFRLDAVPYAFGNSASDAGSQNIEFWTWFNDYCNLKGAQVAESQGWASDDIQRYCYNVGEVWASESIYLDYFKTGMSNFSYSYNGADTSGFAQVANAQVTRSIAANLVDNFAITKSQAEAKDPAAIMSNFLTNHDNDRLSAMFGSVAKLKNAASLYMLMPGNCYIYYGDEIGAKGTGTDPDRRLPFNWGDKSKATTNPPGAVYDGAQDYGTVASQTNDKNSILTYYRETVKLRNRFPEIARGDMTAYVIDSTGALALSETIRETLGNNSITTVNKANRRVAAYTLSWNGEMMMIVHNFGDQFTVNLGGFGDYEVVAELKANGGNIVKNGASLTVPNGAVALLKPIKA